MKSNKTASYVTRIAVPAALCLVIASGAMAQSKPTDKTSQKPTNSADTADKSRAKPEVPVSPDEKPGDMPAGKPAKEAAEKPAKDVTEKPAKDVTEKPTKGAVEEPGKDAAEPSPKEPAGNSDSAIVDNPNDPESVLQALRDQIDGAADPRERTRLQLKLADQLAVNDRKQEAIAELYSITAEDRFDPQNFYNVANALVRLGELDGAVNVYRKAIDQRKGRYSRAFNNMGVVLMRQGRWEESYEAFTSALRLEGFRYAEASYNLGHLYAVRGEKDLAIREWQRALAVNPEHTEAARVLSNAGRVGNIVIEPVGPAHSGSVTAPARPSTRTIKPNSRMSETELPDGNSESPQSLSLDPSTYNLLKRARTARERGRTTEALEIYNEVIARKDGYFPPANLELSHVLFTLKRNDEALATLLPVTQKDGASFPISYYHAARLYELRGDLKLAEQNYNRAVEAFSGNNSQFILDLSRVREKLGNLPGALSAMEQYVSVMKLQGQAPQWSEERLALLRQKVAAAQSASKP